MLYRITMKDTRFTGKQTVYEVEAEDVVTAIFLAGAERGHVEFPEAIQFVKAEIPGDWKEVIVSG